MDAFGDILQQDYGLKPTGKAAPMSAVRSSVPSAPSYPSASIHDPLSSSNSRRNKTANLGHTSGVSLGEDLFFASSNGVNSASSSSNLFGSAAFDNSGASAMYDDVFGGPPKFSSPLYPKGQQTTVQQSYNDLFEMPDKTIPSAAADSSFKSSSLPVFDAPLYDDDIFGGLPGIKNTNVIYDDVFSGISSVGGGSNALDDILGVPSTTGSKDRPSDTHNTTNSSAPSADFVELIPGFGSSEPASFRPANDGRNVPSKSDNGPRGTSSENSFEIREDDPFIMLQSTVPPSKGMVQDAGVNSSTQFTGAYNRKLSNDENFHMSGSTSPHGSKTQSPPRKKIDATSPERQSLQINDDFFQPRKHHSVNSPARSSIRSSSSPRNQFENSSIHSKRNKPVVDEAIAGSMKQAKDVRRRPVDEVWVTVDDVKLVTQPTAAPAPSRRPPPLPGSKGAMNRIDGNLKENHTENFSRTQKDDRKSRADVFVVDEDMMERSAAASASTRAMKEAMEKARSKIPGKGKEENGADEKASQTVRDDGQHYIDENATEIEDGKGWQAETTSHREEIEREEQEKGGEKWHKDREQVREREKDNAGRAAVFRANAEARERAATESRQRAAVERATAEARERAAIEARERAEKIAAERAAVERATAEARERAAAEAREKAAVERATAEARERAAAEARERAAADLRERAAVEAREKAASEAREKAVAEARERAAAERAAVERATAEARERAAAEARERAAAERAAVERATAEARERAAAEARERVAAEARERAANEARARAERAAVERATAEARQRAAERAMAEVREKTERAAAERNAAAKEQRKNTDDLEAFFSSGSRAGNVPSQRSPPKSSKVPSNEGSQKNSNVGTVNKVSSSFGDDWTSLFGAASNAGEFQEVEGETDERRRARLERHQRTAERAAKALEEKNNRDLQAQREQAERHRVGEILDAEIKRWAAGKEDNIRALLSTLQYVLWPECGWQPVSLTELITAAAVKKVYRKATLCVHPDKVQQKGATIQQKYIAEKVFDLLKEAWNKFTKEELQ